MRKNISELASSPLYGLAEAGSTEEMSFYSWHEEHGNRDMEALVLHARGTVYLREVDAAHGTDVTAQGSLVQSGSQLSVEIALRGQDSPRVVPIR